jgi:maltose-binding protein MalE
VETFTEAFQYLLWIQNGDPTVRFADVLNNVPRIKTALTSNALDPNPFYRTFVYQAGTAQIQIFPNLSVSAQYTAEPATYEGIVIAGHMSPKDGLDKVTKDIQTLLD